jgi:hypothetical protein
MLSNYIGTLFAGKMSTVPDLVSEITALTNPGMDADLTGAPN